MKSSLKFILLSLILLIPVVIFLFLKMFGSNQFVIPVYYTEGVPENQQFSCAYPAGAHHVTWPAYVPVENPAVVLVPQKLNSGNRNMVRRIQKNMEEGFGIYVISSDEPSGVVGVHEIRTDSATLRNLLHCQLASDSLDQWILIDAKSRIRGYYNVSLEEQDRLLDEISILARE